MDNVLLKNIDSELREEVQAKMFQGLFNKIKFFNNKAENFKFEFAKHLRQLPFFEGEIVYQQNQSIDYIYLIYSGQLTLYSDLNEFLSLNHQVK